MGGRRAIWSVLLLPDLRADCERLSWKAGRGLKLGFLWYPVVLRSFLTLQIEGSKVDLPLTLFHIRVKFLNKMSGTKKAKKERLFSPPCISPSTDKADKSAASVGVASPTNHVSLLDEGKSVDATQLVTYSNQLRLKNLDYRAREAKQMNKIKALEAQVRDLKKELAESEQHRMTLQKKYSQ